MTIDIMPFVDGKWRQESIAFSTSMANSGTNLEERLRATLEAAGAHFDRSKLPWTMIIAYPSKGQTNAD